MTRCLGERTLGWSLAANLRHSAAIPRPSARLLLRPVVCQSSPLGDKHSKATPPSHATPATSDRSAAEASASVDEADTEAAEVGRLARNPEPGNGGGSREGDALEEAPQLNGHSHNITRPAEAYDPPSKAGPSNRSSSGALLLFPRRSSLTSASYASLAAAAAAATSDHTPFASPKFSTLERAAQSLGRSLVIDPASAHAGTSDVTSSARSSAVNGAGNSGGSQKSVPPGRKGGTTLVRISKDGPVMQQDERKRLQLVRSGPTANQAADEKPDLGTFWGLLVLGLAYVHHSTTGFALPALLPLITPELNLSDTQGSMLTVGYTVLYALALIPAGLLADKADRPRLLAGGLGLWSVLTMVASKVGGFGELLATRVFFAAAQSTQNPICFSLIPELFRKDRTTAMAAYNSAIYMGRALSFAAVIVAGRLGMAKDTGAGGVTMVPLDSLDLSHVSILYTQGEMAAITPIYDYQFSILHSTVTVSSWRQLLFWLGPPGLVIAALALLTLDEPRKPHGSFLGDVFSSSKFTNSTTRGLSRSARDRFETAALESRAKAAAKAAAKAKEEEGPSLWQSVKELCSSPVFQAVTFAAALNDVGSWALVSWQATFYQRVYELGPETYAPALAGILPVGGILGGVGGGLMGDWLSKRGGLKLLTSGATIAASPVLVGNLLAPDARTSFAALLVGFALSEMWRAPAAIMIRDVSPPNLGSTGSAIHLCIRNLMGGAGPLSVAILAQHVGLQKAMLLVPTCYFLSGVSFYFAHRIQDAQKTGGEQPESS